MHVGIALGLEVGHRLDAVLNGSETSVRANQQVGVAAME